ncbi:peptide chain release factor N(5)-glutamine methyltransferase [Alkalimonas mucilaginosa]|uniref:Release factor glutamine methyltransferase n=1 Tax=Alkalimonas mucilaginosa TaxID=3057676 RepID=A0ABU7JIT7_9GAMM|nr:peptide chain release factor N(5)-glutamine methyltransferase [Alkalimonas sp. MEB004]MEE2025341.1 peptide chain release factor N(5)-glutamine methyltransferase [Alkalimonas sp. MEB004]
MSNSSVCSIGSWLTLAKTVLTKVTDEAEAEAKYCLSHVLQCNYSFLYSHAAKLLSAEQWQQLDAILQQRQSGTPLAYVLQQWHFWDFELAVSPATLIPRADTEILVEQALQLQLPADSKVLDLGTGTGAIALALAKERSGWQVTGVDMQPEAVACANRNKAALQLANCDFQLSNWFSAVSSQRYELIVSNPPYIEPDDPHLQQGDVRFEPKTALVADAEGLADIELIITGSVLQLHPGGWLLLEHGYQQAEAVCERLQQAGFIQVQSKKDYGGQWRISFGQRPL